MQPTDPTQAQKGATFRALHEGDPFVIPNPWDAGSAKVLAGLGFEALASTSSGFAPRWRRCGRPPPRSSARTAAGRGDSRA